MGNPWLLFLLLSVFHVVGATVVAGTLRNLSVRLQHRERGGCQSGFLMVWASVFGCLPFGFGIVFLASGTGSPFFLIGQLVVWVATFLLALLAREPLMELLTPLVYPEILRMLFGGGFIVAGVSVVSLLLEVEALRALLAGGILVLTGGALFGSALWQVFRPPE